MAEPLVIAVVGATAAGKSNLALDLAERLDAEIVNADSMQLYLGMDVGTAKLAPAERRGVPHHLLDIWDVTRTASVAEYQRLARNTIDAVHAAGRRVIVVGGSGLYVRAALDHFDFPGTDPELRAALEQRLEQQGSLALHAELALRDPDAASTILPSNGRRIVRALEVVEMRGSYAASLPTHEYVVPAVQLGVSLDRDHLVERIDARVDAMWRSGFVDEVARLEAEGLRAGVTASRAIGYAQILAMLAGQLSEAEAKARTAQATRRFARRQDSWFGRDPRIKWLAPGASGSDALRRLADADQ